jgi:hypothetical protein
MIVVAAANPKVVPDRKIKTALDDPPASRVIAPLNAKAAAAEL